MNVNVFGQGRDTGSYVNWGINLRLVWSGGRGLAYLSWGVSQCGAVKLSRPTGNLHSFLSPPGDYVFASVRPSVCVCVRVCVRVWLCNVVCVRALQATARVTPNVIFLQSCFQLRVN